MTNTSKSMLKRHAVQKGEAITNTPMTSREAFEKFMSDKGLAFNYIGDGQYSQFSVQLASEAWQACEQQNQAAIADLNAKLEWWRELFPSITPKAAVEYQNVYDKADKAEALNAELQEDLLDLRTQVNYRCADVQRLTELNVELVEALEKLAIAGAIQLNDDKAQNFVEVSKQDIRKAIKLIAKVKGK